MKLLIVDSSKERTKALGLGGRCLLLPSLLSQPNFAGSEGGRTEILESFVYSNTLMEYTFSI